eukprot:255935-Heterocapsa_arctica.AAC.1
MNGVLKLKWSVPLQEGDSYGHLKCHRARVSIGTWILGNLKYAAAILNELGEQAATEAESTEIDA